MTTVGQLLREAQERLALASIPDARLEAELLWMTALGVERAPLYAHLEHMPAALTQQAAAELLARRLRREPAAYLMGRREFFGLSFQVAPGIFIPRPETETLVEEALGLLGRWPADRGPIAVADVGTGSGAIAISIAVHLPQVTVYATDLSNRALEVAAVNAAHHGVSGRVSFLHGDLLAPVSKPVDLVLANLPYVRTAELPLLEPEVRLYEPREALDGGEDGLWVIARLLASAPGSLRPGASLLLELDPRQMERAMDLARVSFPNAALQAHPDLAGRDRVLRVTPA